MPNPARVAWAVALGCLIAWVPGSSLAEDVTVEAANAALAAKDYRKAAQLYEALVEQHPDWAPGLKALGQCRLFLGEIDRGREHLEQARQLDPEIDLFEAIYAVGGTLYGEQAYEQSLEPLSLALELAPAAHRPAVAQRTAYAALKAQEYDRARRVLESLGSLDARGRRYLALACQKSGDYDCALASLRRLRDTPTQSSPDVLRDLASWSHYWALKRDNESRRAALLTAAIGDTRGWYEAAPDDAEALRYHTDVLLAADRYTEVVDLARQRTASRPGDCPAWLVLARAHNGLRASTDAEAAARKQIACDPQSVDGRLELAVALMRQVGSDFSNTETARAELARITEATEAVERARAIAPDNTRAPALAKDLETAQQRLGGVVADLTANDEANDAAAAEAEAKRILDRCRTILWRLRDETRPLSDDDVAFNAKHNCKQYATD